MILRWLPVFSTNPPLWIMRILRVRESAVILRASVENWFSFADAIYMLQRSN